MQGPGQRALAICGRFSSKSSQEAQLQEPVEGKAGAGSRARTALEERGEGDCEEGARQAPLQEDVKPAKFQPG